MDAIPHYKQGNDDSEYSLLEAIFKAALAKGANGSDFFGLRLQRHKAVDDAECEQSPQPIEPCYDPMAIAHQVKVLTDMDQEWNSWFAQQKIDPVRIAYDALSANLINVVGGLLEQLGLDRAHAAGLKLPVIKLADSTNLEWSNRFCEERLLSKKRSKDFN